MGKKNFFYFFYRSSVSEDVTGTLSEKVVLESSDTALESSDQESQNRCHDEAANHESQMALAPSRNPSLQACLECPSL